MNAGKTIFQQLICWGWLLMATLSLAESLPVLDIWSGQEQTLAVPTGATWTLVAEHGRELCRAVSSGSVCLHLPALQAGAHENATLYVNDQKQAQVRVWSPTILTGLAARFEYSESKLAQELRRHGLQQNDSANILISTASASESDAAIILIFPKKRDFPLIINELWQEISLRHTKKGGCLSVLYEQDVLTVDCAGNIAYVVCKSPQKKRFLFSPDFDWQAIENILLLKTALEEKKP